MLQRILDMLASFRVPNVFNTWADVELSGNLTDRKGS
jgi:hypothetical protein